MPFDWEQTLPAYLKHDIDSLVEAEKQVPRPSIWDCLYCELYGSINSAMWGNEISQEQAAALREKYLGL